MEMPTPTFRLTARTLLAQYKWRLDARRITALSYESTRTNPNTMIVNSLDKLEKFSYKISRRIWRYELIGYCQDTLKGS